MVRVQDQVAAEIRKDRDVASVVSVLGIGTLNTTLNAARLTIVLDSRPDRPSASVIAERIRAEVSQRFRARTIYVQPAQDIQISTRSSQARSSSTRSPARTSTKLSGLGAQAGRPDAPVAHSAQRRQRNAGWRPAALHRYRPRESRPPRAFRCRSISDTLNSAFGQRQIATIYAQANQYRVILEAAPQYQNDPSALQKLFVTGANGAQAPLEAFATISRVTAPLSIAHPGAVSRPRRSASISKARNPLGDAVAEVDKARAAIDMPDSIVGSFNADAAEFQNSLQSEPWLDPCRHRDDLSRARCILYPRSFAHPFTWILTTLPSAGVGALLAMRFFHHDLSIIALIGIILLMGIVKKRTPS